MLSSYISGIFKKIFFFYEKKILVENFLSLSSFQVSDYLLPIITLPYLVRVLGPAGYGAVIFVQIIMEYCILFSDYGFNYSASKKIATNRNNKTTVETIFANVFSAKLLFMVIGFSTVMLCVFLVPKMRAYWFFYIFAFGILLGRVLIPAWFFQGMERMKYTAIFSFAAKAIFTVLIFIFVRTSSDGGIVLILNSLGSVFAGLASLVFVWRDFDIKPRFPTIAGVINEIREGRYVFISVTSYIVYSMVIPVLLGLMVNYQAVGYYGAGGKLVTAVERMLAPLFQAVYPHISVLAAKSKKEALAFIRKLVRLVGGFTLLLTLGIFVFARPISNIVFGKQFVASIPVVKIMAFIIVTRGVGQVFLSQTMLPFGEERNVFRIALMACIGGILLAVILVPFLKEQGAAWATLFPDVAILILATNFVQRRYHIFRI